MKTKWIGHIALVLILTSCSSEKISDLKDFDAYIKNPENGLIKTKEINGYKLVMQLLPTDYLALKESPKNKVSFDSIKEEYAQSYSFLFTIEPDGEKRRQDIMMSGVRSYEEYKQKFTDLSFGIQEHFSIQSEEASYFPVLSNMEPVYQLKPGRSFNIVFAPQDEESIAGFEQLEMIDVLFEDAFFETGSSHFVFDKNDLESIPTQNLKFNQS